MRRGIQPLSIESCMERIARRQLHRRIGSTPLVNVQNEQTVKCLRWITAFGKFYTACLSANTPPFHFSSSGIQPDAEFPLPFPPRPQKITGKGLSTICQPSLVKFYPFCTASP